MYLWKHVHPNTTANTSLSICVRVHDAYAMGWLSCCNTAPWPFKLASIVGLSQSKYFSTGAFMTSCFSALKLCSWPLSQFHSTLFSSSQW